ncbi:hypothetical protein LINGRAHAP2_LOCUS4598 [Linum grandiflorum]
MMFLLHALFGWNRFLSPLQFDPPLLFSSQKRTRPRACLIFVQFCYAIVYTGYPPRPWQIISDVFSINISVKNSQRLYVIVVFLIMC